MRNVIQTLAPYVGPRSSKAEEASVPPAAETLSMTDAQAKAGPEGSVYEDVPAFLAARGPVVQLASIAIEACQMLTDVPQDQLLPLGTPAELAKLDMLLGGEPGLPILQISSRMLTSDGTYGSYKITALPRQPVRSMFRLQNAFFWHRCFNC